MSETKYTPGPWEMIIHPAVAGGDYIQILAGSWDIAHNRHSTRDWEEELANGHLIVAAPELLIQLKALAVQIEAWHMVVPRGIRAAIAKAEGR